MASWREESEERWWMAQGYFVEIQSGRTGPNRSERLEAVLFISVSAETESIPMARTRMIWRNAEVEDNLK